MVIIKLMGGLGNQLFQYAFGKAYGIKNKKIIRFDIDAYSQEGMKKFSTKREYLLDYFNTSEKGKFPYSSLKRNKIFSFFLKAFNFKEIKEMEFGFNELFFEDNGSVVFDGYWQTEKYFSEIEDIIRNEFILKKIFSVKNFEIANDIFRKNSISIHIRRGDYINDKNTNKFHGVCPIEYYKKAINYIIKNVKEPHFFIFSDDIEWVKNNMKIDIKYTYVSNNKLKNYEELILMSYCKHNIIANSSFSWWGAWLNANIEKIVIAPSKWFANENINTRDIIPQNWIKIETNLITNNV